MIPAMSRFASRLLLTGIAAAILLVPSLCAAEPKPSQREELIARGFAALRVDRPQEAMAAWRAAWDLAPGYDVACNLGTAEFESGRMSEAAKFLSECQRRAPSPLPKEIEPVHTGFLARLALARKSVGVLRLKVSKPGATIKIDQKTAGRSPLEEVFVEPGRHEIQIERDGYKPVSIRVSIKAGEERSFAVVLVEAKPDLVARAAPARRLPSPGIPPLSEPMPVAPMPFYRDPLFIAGGASTGAALALGGVLSGIAAFKRAEADRTLKLATKDNSSACSVLTPSEQCRAYERGYNTAATLGDVATASFIAGGVLGAATLTISVARSNNTPVVTAFSPTFGGFVGVASW